MATTTTKTNKPILPRGLDNRPVDSYNRAELYSGKALDFDGVNDYVDVPYLDSLANTGVSSTFSFYFNVDTITGSIVFAEQRKAASKRYVVWYDHANTRLQLYLNSVSSVINFPLTETNQWFYFTGVVDGSTAKMYINGELIGSTSYAPFESNVDFYLGTYDGASGYFYNGKMSNAKIFNTALTATQVADLYNNPEKIVPTGVANTALKLWLPMQEGAGTTAYDGSGNGNHGTISGATYVHGIGAPVSQTAVIDWNKNKNSITHSTDFSAAAGWLSLTSGGGTAAVTNGYAESPYGGQTAARLQATKGTGYGVISFTPAVSTSGTYVSSVWAKSNTGSTQSVSMYSRNSTTGKQDITTEWTRFEFTGSGSSNYFNIGSLGTADASIDVLLWGAQMVLDATEVGAYVPTYDSAQTSPVLLPQGLTTGRDITGVNLFENVRKQGALNLDGNSWAEVHDNESLDITSAITLEAWVYWDDTQTAKGLIGKWNYGAGKASYLLYKHQANNFSLFVSNNGTSVAIVTNVTSISNGWNHLIGVYDGTNIKCYLNGVVDGSVAYSSLFFTSDLPVDIGRLNNDTASNYTKPIAQPRIYNRALTAEEVQRNYNAGKNTYTN